MDQLSDQLLVETYIKAVQLGLDEDFKEIIVEELNRRGITETEIYQTWEIHNNREQIRLHK